MVIALVVVLSTTAAAMVAPGASLVGLVDVPVEGILAVGLIFVELFRSLRVEVFPAARIEEAVEPIMFVFFVASDLAIGPLASSIVPIVVAPVVATSPVPLVSSAILLVIPVLTGLAFPLVVARVLDIAGDVAPALHLIGYLFHIQRVGGVGWVNALVVG